MLFNYYLLLMSKDIVSPKVMIQVYRENSGEVFSQMIEVRSPPNSLANVAELAYDRGSRIASHDNYTVRNSTVILLELNEALDTIIHLPLHVIDVGDNCSIKLSPHTAKQIIQL